MRGVSLDDLPARAAVKRSPPAQSRLVTLWCLEFWINCLRWFQKVIAFLFSGALVAGEFPCGFGDASSPNHQTPEGSGWSFELSCPNFQRGWNQKGPFSEKKIPEPLGWGFRTSQASSKGEGWKFWKALGSEEIVFFRSLLSWPVQGSWEHPYVNFGSWGEPSPIRTAQGYFWGTQIEVCR